MAKAAITPKYRPGKITPCSRRIVMMLRSSYWNALQKLRSLRAIRFSQLPNSVLI